VYGISDFMHHSRSGALKYHEKYQEALKRDAKTFRRQNGEFTVYADEMKSGKF
jgi:hypothetical protein